jgi:hypothetical protein
LYDGMADLEAIATKSNPLLKVMNEWKRILLYAQYILLTLFPSFLVLRSIAIVVHYHFWQYQWSNDCISSSFRN